jgi:glucans biosynthesis protein
MHGAGGGAPNGNRNAYKHGLYTAEARAERRAIRALLRESGELLEWL